VQILELEEKYSELKSDLSGQISRRTKLLKISGYLGVALSNPISQLVEPYIVEFIPDFLKSIHDIEIRGLNPELLQSLNEQIQKLKALNLSDIDFTEIEKAVEVLKGKIDLLNDWINNKNISSKNAKVFFPLLERIDDSLGTGYLESVSIVIKNSEQKFHISPADLENDEQLEKQVQLCFKKATEYCKQYIKHIKTSHTVYLHFENRLGILTGNSLGAALTLSFIETILKHYNSPIILKINNCVAITGGIDPSSKIISTSKTIIEAKVETVFFSDVQIFCIPKIDEMWAEEKLKHLKENYPNRNLKIVGLIDLDDLLDRRQIVEIKKQPIIKRTGKFVKKNWISAFASVLLAILFAYLFVMDFDDNPASISSDGKLLFVKNKNGKLLWTLNHWIPKDYTENTSFIKDIIQIVDINGDNQYEVLFTPTQFKSENGGNERGTIVCFDKSKNEKWKYVFRDTVISTKEKLGTIYDVELIDTTSYNNEKILICCSKNATSFSSAIFTLDLKTGKRINKTLWCSGFIWDGIVTNLPDDTTKYFVSIGADNGLGAGVVWGIKLDSLSGVRPSSSEYTIQNLLKADLLFYIQIPKTDFNNYIGSRTEGMIQGSLEHNKLNKKIKFTTHIANDSISISSLHYYLDENLVDIDISVTDQFSRARDSLVTKGILKKPFTDTKEFVEIQKNKILYWQNGKWVNRKELFKNE